MSSMAKMVADNGALNVPLNTATIVTSAQNPGPPKGKICASNTPSAPPIISRGANVPPEVPEDRATIQTTTLPTKSDAAACIGIVPLIKASMLA